MALEPQLCGPCYLVSTMAVLTLVCLTAPLLGVRLLTYVARTVWPAPRDLVGVTVQF